MQVCFIQDYLRAGWDGGNAERCGRWLHALVGPILRQAGFGTSRLCLAHAAVRAFRAECRHLSWPALFSDPGKALYHAVLLPYLRQADLVIGFELSPNQMRILQAASIPFIDAAIDPLRFGGDLFLALRTNVPALAGALAALETGADAIPRSTWLATPTNRTSAKTLFVGQTDIDASLITEGRIARIDPFLPILGEQLGRGETLWLKPHPHGRYHGSIRTLHERFPKSRILTDNAYALLASGQVSRVLTLSSGMAAEAPFFGVPATELIKPDSRHVENVSRAFRLSPSVLPLSLRRTATGVVASLTSRTGSLRSRLGLTWAEPEPGTLPDRQVRHGDTIEFGDRTDRRLADGVCVSGWSHAEPTGRWTDGSLATMLLSLRDEPLDLTLQCRAYLRDAVPLRLKIEVRGKSVSHKRLTLRSEQACDISIALPRTDELIEVVFYVHNPVVPSTWGASNDHRALGLHVMSATMHRRGKYRDRFASVVQAIAANAAVLKRPGLGTGIGDCR